MDEARIREWWALWPDANIAISTGPSDLCVVDIDHGLSNASDLAEFCKVHNLPLTYVVKTGRTDGFGAQLYFEGSGLKSIAWLDGEQSGDIRCSTGYVMAAGSVHPSGESYKVVSQRGVALVPDYVLTLKPERGAGVVDDGSPITTGRNNALTSIAGKLRNAGLSANALEAALLQVNADRCAPPLDDDEVRAIASHAAAWKLPEVAPKVFIGKRVAEVQEDADDVQESSRPVYPDEVWNGTAYGEFADLCTRDNYIPKKFFSESMRTVVGAIVGDRLRCPLTGVSPRAYTIKIAPPGSGKGTSDEYVRLFFADRWEGMTRTEAALIWQDPAEIMWKSRGLGAQICTVASAPGLMMAIEPRKLKKGDTANPLESWKPMPRIISMTEEVRSLFANFANESTGASLESVLCELFDRDSFTTTATKDRPPTAGKLMFSLLGGITKEGWDAVFSKTESVESGFLSRVCVIGTEEGRTKSGLRAPDFSALRNKFFPLLQALERTPRTLDASPSALALMDRWYSRLELPEGISRARLNIHAWRTALHLAWLHGHGNILDVDVDGGIKVAEFQAKMREFYAPPEGETRAARCEAAIRKTMRGKRRAALRDLRRLTHSNRFGIGLWDRALQDMTKAGEIRVEEGERGRRTVILLKNKD